MNLSFKEDSGQSETRTAHGSYGFLFHSEFFFSDNTTVRIFFFSPEFNIRLYDKNNESDYFFFLHQNQNIFSATLGIRIFFLEKNHTPPFKLNGCSLRRQPCFPPQYDFLIVFFHLVYTTVHCQWLPKGETTLLFLSVEQFKKYRYF